MQSQDHTWVVYKDLMRAWSMCPGSYFLLILSICCPKEKFTL